MSLSSTDPKVLMGQAKCFACLSPSEQSQTYLLAKIAGLDTSKTGVNSLAAASACFSCLTIFQLKRIKQYLLATWLGVDTSLAGIRALVAAAKCVPCLTPAEQQAVQIYLLAVMAGQATDSAGVAAIARAAACFDCLTTKQEFEVQVYILTGLSNASSSAPSDLAAAARCFISCLPYELSETVQSNLITQAAGRLTPPCVTPTAPVASAGAKVITNTTIRVLWNQISNTGSLITGYIVKWGTTSGVYTNSATVPVIPRVYDITGLTAGTQYFWVIQAITGISGCVSANSNEGTGTTTGAAPNGLLNNLAAYYKFDDDQVNGGTTVDSSGNGHGLLLNVAGIASGNTNCPNGEINGALCLGAGGTFASNGDAVFQMGLGVSFTFSLWIFSTDYSSVNDVFYINTFDNNSLAASAYWLVHTNVPPLAMRWAAQDTGNNVVGVGAGTQPTNGVWTHIVVGFDAGTSQIFMYFNGGARQNAAMVTNGIKVVATQFHCGATTNNAAPAQPNQKIDEMGLWKNRVLSATDVANLFNGGAGLPYSSFTV